MQSSLFISKVNHGDTDPDNIICLQTSRRYLFYYCLNTNTQAIAYIFIYVTKLFTALHLEMKLTDFLP